MPELPRMNHAIGLADSGRDCAHGVFQSDVRRIRAEQAAEWGLVDVLVPADRLDAEAIKRGQKPETIAAMRKALGL